MSKPLILDWQKNSLLLARAQGRSSKPTIEAVAIKAVGNAENVSNTAAEALRAAAKELDVKGEVSVLVSRDLVELRTVQIPKMDADELPDVIRFQAQRQFANMTDAWTVDFVMLPVAAGNEMQTALVAAISPTNLGEIESACTSAGLSVTSIGLRPLQIVQKSIEAGLVSGSARSMIVCVSDSAADLLILREGKVLQIRSTKLPHEVDQVGTALQGEVRRSFLAAASELESKPVDSILLIAPKGKSDSLIVALQQTSPATVVAFHPETLLTNCDPLIADTAGSRLMAVAGAVGLKSADRASVIDFKKPKRRPPKKRDSRKWLLIGGAAAVLLVAAVGWYFSTVGNLDSELAFINEEIEAKKAAGDAAQKQLTEYEAIEQFANQSLNWLDELTYISQSVPNSDKIMLESSSFTVSRTGVGIIDVKLKANDRNSISEFGRSLTNESYKVSPGPNQDLPKPDGLYKVRGDVKLEVTGKGWNLRAAPATPSTSDSSQKPTVASSIESTDVSPNPANASGAVAKEEVGASPTERAVEKADAKSAAAPADSQPVSSTASEAK